MVSMDFNSKQDYEIKIGNLNVDFSVNDPIFHLYEPLNLKLSSDSCRCCNDSLKKQKAVVHCDFCGHRACDKCLHKKRTFIGEHCLQQNELLVSDSGNKELHNSISTKRNSMPAKMTSSNVEPSNTQLKGKCCKICDRKFMVLALYNKF